MIKFVRRFSGETLSMDQARHELRKIAADAGVPLAFADGIVDGAARGDRTYWESLRDFLDVECMESRKVGQSAEPFGLTNHWRKEKEMSVHEPNSYVIRRQGWWTVEARHADSKAGPFRTLADATKYATDTYGCYSVVVADGFVGTPECRALFGLAPLEEKPKP